MLTKLKQILNVLVFYHHVIHFTFDLLQMFSMLSTTQDKTIQYTLSTTAD